MYLHTNMYKQIHVCKDAFINIMYQYVYIYIHISFVESGVYCIYVYIYMKYIGFSNLSELYGQPSYGMESKRMFTSLSSGII